VNFSPRKYSVPFTFSVRCPIRPPVALLFPLDNVVFIGYTSNNILYKGYDCERVTGWRKPAPMDSARELPGGARQPERPVNTRNQPPPERNADGSSAHFSRVGRVSRR